MAVAKNKDDLEEIRANDLSKKIKLEVPFKRDVGMLLRRINSDFAQQYTADGTVINAKEYKPELMTILAANYNRISKFFKFNIRESFDEKVSPEINAKINANINQFIKDVSNPKSDIILDTTNKEILTELFNTTNTFIEEERDITNFAVANETRKGLNLKVPGRANIISISETQNGSESVKTIEEETLIDNNVVIAGLALAALLKDVWVTTLDEVTRVNHVIANLQEKSPLQSFLVGGELLRYPGDPAGSPGNIINCRCVKVVSIF